MLQFDSPARLSVRLASLMGLAGAFKTARSHRRRHAVQAAVGVAVMVLVAHWAIGLRAAPASAGLLAAPGASAQTTQDLNGDGRVDAVFTQKQRYNKVCFGNGAGAFTTCTDLMGAGDHVLSNQTNTTASALVDWNNDGHLDIVLAMEGRSSVVCYNDGAGDFNTGLGCVEVYGYNAFPYDSQDVAVGDLTGDGIPDMVFAMGGNAGTPLNQSNVVCRGFNTGASDCSQLSTTAPSTGVALGDVDGDGDLDILVSNRGTLNEVCLNNGNGTSFDCRPIPQAGNVSAPKESNAVAVGHLSAGWGATPDVHLDVVFANTGRNEYCFGNGNWSGADVGLTCSEFPVASTYTTSDASARTTDIIVADIVTNPAGNEVVFVNDDAPNVRCLGTFVSCGMAFDQREIVNVEIGGTIYAVSEPIIESTTGVAVRDINIDGKPEVVVANTGLTGGISRTYLGFGFSPTTAVVANSVLYPTSITLSGGTIGPSADTEPPAFFGATDRTAEATGPTGATVSFNVTAQDTEDGSRPVTCTPVTGSLFALGNTTVTCTASDTSGNVGTATFVVTVRDTTGPVVTVPANMSVLAPAGQTTTAVTFVTSAVDIVDGAVSTFCYDTATNFGVSSGAQFAGGTTTLMCYASDARNNYSQTSFTVTVITDIDSDGILDDVDIDDDGDGIADTVDPEPIVYSNSYAFDGINTGPVTRNGWTVSIAPTPAGSAYDLRATLSGVGTAPAVIQANCGFLFKQLKLNAAGDTLDWRCDASLPGAASLGVNFVSGSGEFWKGIGGQWVRMTPTAGNTAVTAGSPVTADATNTSPVLVTIFDQDLAEIGSFSLGAAESVDVEEVEINGEPTLQLEVLNGGPDGTVAVTLFGQTVTLQQGTGPATFDLNPDLTPPVIAAQVSGTLGTNGFYTSDVSVTWTVTDEESAATSTGCDTQSVVEDTSGVTFTCAAQSEGGTASETVTIKRDATAPVITVPADIITDATSGSGAVVTYAATAADQLDGAPSVSCAPASGATFAVGTTTVLCTATDAAGNQASASFSVTVVGTTAPPTVEEQIRAIAGSSADQLVRAAQNVASAPNGNAKNGRVTAYQNQVNAQLKSRKITAAQATQLLALVNQM